MVSPLACWSNSTSKRRSKSLRADVRVTIAPDDESPVNVTDADLASTDNVCPGERASWRSSRNSAEAGELANTRLNVDAPTRVEICLAIPHLPESGSED
jgi:hypothetical protein